MPDCYSNFKELQSHEQEGQDYRISFSGEWRPVLIIAPHGGRIEPYTTEIAKWIAGEEFAWYSFEGLKDGVGNRKLHITSHNFDEPVVLRGLKEAGIVLTVHGLKDSSEEFLMIGGLDSAFGLELSSALQVQGFSVKQSEPRYQGIRTTNICNCGRTGKGVQLEISFALRKRVFEDIAYRTRFVDTIRALIKQRLLNVVD
ncbi:poly-gamma-glutamate hydrolase family protein [Desulfosporosinus sp. PR]|uniref:poly-gamma-glutamate hydrolase family protein n=1 Tax=Candidatus Desulfosporosinus nitrosoreducens TaxID=3401928 RepID=UPI0027EA10C8|nr:poly-gamma-glutamate hydrolase family protein [Desulfosporosinus sp. PR]MDQ7095288.1 poly-gamma-glutamate hydrolase family protein [Desulfosporosinus sp. PR]